MDHLKTLAARINGKLETQSLSNANFKEKSSRKIVVRNYVNHKIIVNEFGTLFEIGIYTDSAFHFTINNADWWYLSRTQSLQVVDCPYPIFSQEIENIPPFHDHTGPFWKAFFDFIRRTALAKEETIFIHRNCIEFALQYDRDLATFIDEAIQLLSIPDSPFKKEVTTTLSARNVPNERLKPLITLCRKWSVSDDVERDELIATAATRRKANLVRVVYPLMPEINQFLDTFRDHPLSEEAIQIGNLAELVWEIQLDVESRIPISQQD